MTGLRLIRDDALEALFRLEAGIADAFITDPPYCSGAFQEAARRGARGQGLRSETLRNDGWFVNDNMGTSGLVWLLRGVALEARRILKASGSLLVFCDWRMLCSLAPAIESAGLRFQNLIAWDKGSAGLGTGFRCQHELILHFTNGAPEYFDASVGNVIRAGRVPAAEREHQAQKPVALLEQLVRVVSPPGGLVVDCFFGSGSLGVACERLGRNCIGIDIDPQQTETARARLEGDAPLFEAVGS